MPVSDLRALRQLVLLTGLLLTSVALADYKQDYARGKNAASDENWSEVEFLMQKALQGSSTPLARTRLYGQRFEPYIPQYYLGLAAYRQGDCSKAMRWFGDAAAAPIIAGNSEFKGIADQAMQSCKRSVAEVKPPPIKPETPVSKPPTQTTTSPVANTTPQTTPSKPPAQQTPATQPPVAAPPLPATLQTLLDDYLAGRFSKAALADANTLSGPARFHGLLFRSAARYALFEIDPINAAAQKSAAEGDVRLAKSLAPGKSPDAGFFSPRYRKFFSEVR